MGLLYTKMKIFHFKDKIDSLIETSDKILPPVHIRLKPTNVCNQNCSYCSYRSDKLQLGKDMVISDYIPREKIMEIIDDIAEMEVKAVTFSGGGEPFCYPYLMDAVKKLSKTAVKFAAITNGSLLQGKLAEAFARNGTWLRVSIDGWDDESYSHYRRVPKGEFTKVIENMKNFKRIGGTCYLGVYIVIDRKNVPHIYDLIVKLKNIGVNSVKIAPCIVSDSGKENNEYHEPIFNTVKEQISKARKLEDKEFQIFDSYHRQLETFQKDYSWCPYIQVCPIIGADLNVYTCHDKAYNLKEGMVGSIKNQGFKEFWFSDKDKFFRINPSLQCNHHCMVNDNNKLILDYLEADEEHLDFV